MFELDKKKKKAARGTIASVPKKTFANAHAVLSYGSIFGACREEVKGTQWR